MMTDKGNWIVLEDYFLSSCHEDLLSNRNHLHTISDNVLKYNRHRNSAYLKLKDFGIPRNLSFSHFVFYLTLILTCLSCPTYGFCPSKCFCDDNALEVLCTNASLEIVPFLLNPQTTSLSLPCNKIESIGQSLAFYPELVEVDLSYNKIGTLDSGDFESQTKLKILNLNHNTFKTIPNRSFVNLNSLKELYIRNNNVSVIQSSAFDSSFELRILDLSNNKLNSLKDDTFSQTSKLEILKLNFNYFTSVPFIALHKLRSVKELELNGNLISDVPRNAFRSLKDMTSLSLDKNNISILYPESFNGMPELASLSLKDNRLATISSQAFRPINQLKNLALSGNLFENIEGSSFTHVKSLQHLYIDRCPRLYSIDSATFSPLSSLETLKLSHNARLVYLGDSIFASLHNLKDLDLTACGLIYVHPDQMPRNSQTRLHLAGNPFHCNCSLLWLASLPFNETLYFDTPTCATPPDLYGIPVNKVDLRAAGCPQQLGVAAIGTCIGIILLSLLAAILFLTWRWRQRSPPPKKGLTGKPENVLREPWSSAINPNNHLTLRSDSIYTSKCCIPAPLPQAPCGHPECQSQCQTGVPKVTYGIHPATRPLLTPPSPSVNSQTYFPVEWYYPSPYDDEIHWYSTIGKDGQEYLTGELKKDRPPLPPIPRESPPVIHSPSTSSSSVSSSLTKRHNSFNRHRMTPTLDNRIPVNSRKPPIPPLPVFKTAQLTDRNPNDPNENPAVFKLQEGVTLGDIARNPITYI